MECPICSAQAELKSREQYGYQSSFKYEIYHCKNCSTAFASPLKVDQNIYNCIYAKAREVPGYGRYFDYAEKVLEAENPLAYLAEAEDVYWGIQQFLQTKNRPLKILEVGCGFGYLTYALKKAGHDVMGIDISKVAVDGAAKRYGNIFACEDVREMAKREGPKYDLIVFTEVIEHIDNVKDFMQAVNSLLLPGGHLLVTTPNKTPYPEDILWETEPPPVHLLWLSENSMRHLAKEMKHEVEFIDFKPLNCKEFLSLGCYFSPTVSIGNYMPTRLPRLDEKGEVMKEMPTSIHNWPEYHHLLQPQPVKKSLTERVLNKLCATVPGLRKWQIKLDGYFSKEEFKRKLNAIPKTRPTMCAIFTKSS